MLFLVNGFLFLLIIIINFHTLCIITFPQLVKLLCRETANKLLLLLLLLLLINLLFIYL